MIENAVVNSQCVPWSCPSQPFEGGGYPTAAEYAVAAAWLAYGILMARRMLRSPVQPVSGSEEGRE